MRATERPDRARYLFAMIAFAITANTPVVVQPMVVGAMVDLLKLSERQAGLVASVELSGLTIGLLVLMRMLTRVKRMHLVALSVGGIVTANLATCFIHDFVWLLPARFLSGLGAAAAFCIFCSMASSSGKPEHNFAIANTVTLGFSGLLTILTPSILSRYGLPGVVSTFVLITLVALVASRWVWLAPSDSDSASRAGNRLITIPLLLLLTMMLLLYAGHGAIWAYQERIGVASGLSDQIVSKALGFSVLVWGVSGSMIARLSSLRLGRVWPQVISLGASCAAVIFLVFGSSSLEFWIASGLIAFSWFYGLPYQMGLLALHDPTGRAAVAGTMMSTAGMAIGPACAAALLIKGAHWPLGVFAGICYLAALGIAIPSARALSMQGIQVMHVR